MKKDSVVRYSALDIADYFVKKASEFDENDLTNLKLQKLLYFAQGEYLSRKKRKLFKEEIEAWQFGPVVRTVYNQFKQCGSFPVNVFDIKIKAKKISSPTSDFLDKIWNEYGKYSANHLVTLTHKKNSPWSTTYAKGENRVISTELLSNILVP